MFKVIWNDTVAFVEAVWSWIEKEAEDFWNNGGAAVLKEVGLLAEEAFTAWTASNPTNLIFSEFVGFAGTYIKNNWKNDLVILEDAVIHFVLGKVGIKYQIPSTATANGGVLIGGTQTGA